MKTRSVLKRGTEIGFTSSKTNKEQCVETKGTTSSKARYRNIYDEGHDDKCAGDISA